MNWSTYTLIFKQHWASTQGLSNIIYNSLSRAIVLFFKEQTAFSTAGRKYKQICFWLQVFFYFLISFFKNLFTRIKNLISMNIWRTINNLLTPAASYFRHFISGLQWYKKKVPMSRGIWMKIKKLIKLIIILLFSRLERFISYPWEAAQPAVYI